MPKADPATLARIKRTEAYAEKVRRMFAQTVNDILALNKRMPDLEPGEMFSFEDEKNARMLREAEALLRRLHSASTMAIEKGIKLEWAKANDETDKLLASCFGKRVLEDSNFRGWMSRNNEARQAFITRTERGMNLSERVWKSTRQLRDEMEVAMTLAIGEGESAASMSRKVRQYLNDPDLMFRRFRYKDVEGNWQRMWKKRITDPETGKHTWIDYDKDSYRDQWTGRGYYKSSAQNAMRVARTETNMAYRAADNARWEQLDFIRGIHIQPSESHPAPDICDTLQGDYPKTFKFSGWHPQCFCIMTPVTVSDDEMVAMADARRDGVPYKPETPEITDYPDNFKSWVERNADNIKRARERGTEPYFLRDNAEATNRFMRYAETIKVGNDEYTVRQLINESKVIKTENGMVYLHPAHGFDEREENIGFASWRANNFGEEVILLPNPQGAKSADSFNITRGVSEEYKRSQAPSKNSISQLIRKGSEQADHIILEPHGDIKRGVLESGIRGRVNQCGIKEVRIKIGEFEALYSRNTILSPDGFKIRPEDFRNAVVSRNEVQGTLGPISDAKLKKFFESTKSAPKLTPKQIADARHAARTPEQVAKIQSAWNTRRLTQFEEAVAKGLLPKEAVASLRALNDAKDFEAFKRKSATLSKVANKHASRTEAAIDTINNTWAQKLARDAKTKRDAQRVLDLAKGWGSTKDAVRTSALEAVIAENNLTKMVEETDKVMVALKAVRAEEKALADIIPDVHGWHKQFTMAELREAHTKIQGTLAYWKAKGLALENDSTLATLKNELEKKIKFVENPGAFKAGLKPHATWQLQQKAYGDLLDKVDNRIQIVAIEADYTALLGFKTTSKDFKEYMAKAKAALDAGDVATAKHFTTVAGNKKKMLEASRKGKTKGSGSTSTGGAVKFSEDCFTDARRGAARIYKNNTEAEYSELFDTACAIYGAAPLEFKEAAASYTAASGYLTKYLRGMKGYLEKDLNYAKSADLHARALSKEIGKATLKHDTWLFRDERASFLLLKAGGLDPDKLQAQIEEYTRKITARYKAKGRLTIKMERELEEKIAWFTDWRARQLVGKQGIDPSMLSCGSHIKHAFSGTGGDNRYGIPKVRLEIYCPEGTQAMYAAPFNVYNTAKTEGRFWDGKSHTRSIREAEVFLQRDTEYRIIAARWDAKEDRWFVKVEVLGHHAREFEMQSTSQGYKAKFK